jgi:Fe/S biogenesis protein NfuA
MLTVTESARTKVLELIQSQGRAGLHLRAAIAGRGPGGFQYRLGFVGEEERRADDRVIEAGGFNVLVDAESAPNLEGASIDYVEGPQGSGFKVDNPNPLWKDPDALAVQRVLDTEINPAVAGHGGWVTLLDVKDNVAYLQLGGGCQGCGMADVTLKQGIEVRIREAVPAIREIIDSTDHAGGKNPFFQPAKGGRSPF